MKENKNFLFEGGERKKLESWADPWKKKKKKKK